MYAHARCLSAVEPSVRFLPKIDMSEEVDDFLPTHSISSPERAGITVSHESGVFSRLYESKLMWQFDHRFGTFENCSVTEQQAGNCRNPAPTEKRLPSLISVPRYFISHPTVCDRYSTTHQSHLLAVRRLTNATNERTGVFAVLPFVACGNSMFAFTPLPPQESAWLASCGNSFACDFLTRNKLGGTNLLQFILEQLAFVSWSDEHSSWCGSKEFVTARVIELTFTAWDLEAFGADCGYAGPPFRWDENRRFMLRSELDAAFFHLYLGTPDEWERDALPALKARLSTPRHAVDHIMETFPIVRKKDIEAHGAYRTKDTILSIYDDMAEAIRMGKPYRTRLDPPPADASCRHSESTRPSWAKPIQG